MKYNRKNLVNNALIQGSRDYMKTEFLKGESVSEPIAPEGLAQVFADAECREYATGILSTVYVRLNTAFEFGDRIQFGSGNDPLEIVTPTQAAPNDPYSVVAYVDFMSEDRNEPFQSGDVIRCDSIEPSGVTGYRTIFYGNE